MHLRDIAKVIVVSAVLAVAAGSPVATADTRTKSDDPVEFIEKLADQALNVLAKPQGTLLDREENFRTLLRDDFAMARIGRFVVGAYWRKMSKRQRKNYQKLFGEWVLKTYSMRLGGYTGESFEIVKSTKAGRRDVIVHTRIQRDDGNGFNANWRVRNINGRYKIIDIYVEGISMAVTQRSEFESILRRHGVEGLLTRLRNRLEIMSQPS